MADLMKIAREKELEIAKAKIKLLLEENEYLEKENEKLRELIRRYANTSDVRAKQVLKELDNGKN